MRKKLLLLCFILITSSLMYSQGEANVWYFGNRAGLDFNTGNPIALTDGQVNTEEGCASISDSTGQLLFYTDGITVYNSNHQIMSNGTGLMGDTSTTQSATIVPKPGSNTIFYIFTIDVEAQIDGFRYSIVDLSLNGGLGEVTSEKNVLVYTPTCEKIAVIKHANNIDFWVVTHGFGNNNYYSHLLTSTGLSSSGIVSSIGFTPLPAVVSPDNRRSSYGYMKIASTGTKLAVVHASNSWETGVVELLDFNNTTGAISNSITLLVEMGEMYGVEFSPNNNILYYSNISSKKIIQFDLTAADIPNSAIVFNFQLYPGALQQGPDGKIYFAQYASGKLGVINNPNTIGLGCNIQIDAIDLQGKVSILGLPTFSQSFLNVSFTAQNFCLGDATNFVLNINEQINSILWDFGDGNTSSNINNSSHQYTNAGNYNVVVTAVTPSQTITRSKSITIYQTPIIANSIPNQSLCGLNSINYNLTQNDSAVFGNQSTVEFDIAYFNTFSDATNHINILPDNLTLPLGNSTVYAKIFNKNNLNCYAITSFIITLYNQPIANTVSLISVCDDSTNNGFEIVNLNNLTPLVIGGQNNSTITVSYHLSQQDADMGINDLPGNYQNISNPQIIFVRVENNLNSSCYSTTNFQVSISKMAIANTLQNIYVCDDSTNNQEEVFNLASQTPSLLGGQLSTEFNVSYHLTQNDAINFSNSLPLNYQNISNPQTIFVRVYNILNTNCFAISSFELQVFSKPNLVMETTYSICQGVPITIEAPSGFSSYNWSTGSNSDSTTILQDGIYTLTVTQNHSLISCDDSITIAVVNSNIATITQVETDDWTSTENSITVVADGDGDYEYSLDGLTYQESNNFYGLSSGEYTIYVKDKNGCGITNKTIYLLMYPKFFTPNNDGINDKWFIKNSSIEPNMELFIYNRYGKLLKQISSQGEGWDGTLNGSQLQADDYWFIVKRENGKEFRGHFSLKR